ncbi:MAG: DEAD/DEAH box helicase [Myxococcaceae bacterium]
MNLFTDFKLLPSLQASIAEKGLVKPTDIQEQVIPALLDGGSLVGVSETGSGKTLSFALPILHILKTLENSGDSITAGSQPRAAVIVPTRELGEQLSKVFKPFTHTTRLRVRVLLGNSTPEVAKKNIAGIFEVIIATPGRLVKMLDRKLINLSDVRVLVFDEADQMLDQGFLPDARRIIEACPESRQMGLFSATISPAVQKLINELFTDAQLIRSKGSASLVSSLKTINREVIDGERFVLLEKILREKAPAGGTLIFTNTREQCDKLVSELDKKGQKCAVYRGQMDKVERRSNLKAFRDGKVRLLVSTDLASRGLDVEHVGRVINYHLPRQLENYIHRVGRTARARRPGTVINMVTERDGPLMLQVANI